MTPSTHPLQFILVYFGPFPLEENVRPLKVDFAKKNRLFKKEFRHFFGSFPQTNINKSGGHVSVVQLD